MADQRPSKKQFELLQFIEGFIKGNGYGPSYREIMRALDYKSVSTVAVHVDGLIARGYLRKRDHSARSLEVVSNYSGNPVEKQTVNEHETWLKDSVMRHIETAKEAKTPESLQNAQALVHALHILELHDTHRYTKTQLDSVIKQLDQTT
jgi:repressor LexA